MAKERLTQAEQGKLDELIHYLFGLAEVVEGAEGFELAGVLVPLVVLERGRFTRELNAWPPVFCFVNRSQRLAIAIAAEKKKTREGKFAAMYGTVPDVSLVRNKIKFTRFSYYGEEMLLSGTGASIQKQVSSDYLINFGYINANDLSFGQRIRWMEKFLGADFGKIRAWAIRIFEEWEGLGEKRGR